VVEKKALNEELKRIKQLMVYDMNYHNSKIYEDVVTSSKVGQCKTTPNPIQENEVAIISFDKNKSQFRVGMKLFFGSAKTETQLKNGFDKLINLILQYPDLDEGIKNKIKSGEFALGIPTVLNVIGSASSVRGVPVMPTITNNKASTKITSINVNSFASNINRTADNYKTLKDDEINNGYATGRIQTITDFIKSGKLTQIQSGMDVGVKSSVAVITDTGGCDDEHRNTDIYPNAGQFALLDMYVTLSKKIIVATNPSTCINKLTIKIGYDKDLATTELQKHECDFGIFNVYANDVFVKTINLNNYVFDTGLRTRETNVDGLKITDFTEGRESDGLTGGTRFYTITINQNDKLWNDIMANAPKFGNHIMLSYKGFPSAWYAGKKIYAQGARNSKTLGPAKKWDGSDAESHASAVYLDITLYRKDKTKDNIKGWTTATARGVQMITIADLTPCSKSSDKRIVIS
jgi:hypothetical protein